MGPFSCSCIFRDPVPSHSNLLPKKWAPFRARAYFVFVYSRERELFVGSCRGFSTLPTAPLHQTGLLVKKPEDPTSKEEAVLRRPFRPSPPIHLSRGRGSPFLRRRRGLRRRRASATTRYIRSPLLFPSCQYCFLLCQNRAPQTLMYAIYIRI
jgi:hypothetical protein